MKPMLIMSTLSTTCHGSRPTRASAMTVTVTSLSALW